MLRGKGIHKTYRDGKKDLHVLQGIDLEVKKGETLGITGPSGAGKSTLLHILGGIDRPDSGNVFLNEEDFYKLSDNKRAALRNKSIGFVFQFYHLLSEFTALENAMMPALLERQGMGGKGQGTRESAAGLLKEFGLGSRLRHRPSELSGGEQQRVAIARSLINNPDVLLCDEPTGNLDSKMGKGILDILFGLKSALIIVTHDREIVKRADRVLEVKDGRIA